MTVALSMLGDTPHASALTPVVEQLAHWKRLGVPYEDAWRQTLRATGIPTGWDTGEKPTALDFAKARLRRAYHNEEPSIRVCQHRDGCHDEATHGRLCAAHAPVPAMEYA